MDKAHILSELKRTAESNGGSALGWRRFEEVTGIGYYDWFGQYWTRWNDAVREAGLQPNRMTKAYDDNLLIQQLVLLTRSLTRVPTQGDLLLARKKDETFPAKDTFRRLGSKGQLAQRILSFCEANPGNEDVAELWKHTPGAAPPRADLEFPSEADAEVGFVYLLQHGSRREYKIGRTCNALRREGELEIELPEKVKPIHYIETDDPAGIEAYWHRRFRDKRKQGEWFTLTPQDVRAFKRWKRIY